jgi:hypothetical protein
MDASRDVSRPRRLDLEPIPRNALKLTYEHLKFQKVSGYKPRTPEKERKGGEGNGGEGRGEERRGGGMG